MDFVLQSFLKDIPRHSQKYKGALISYPTKNELKILNTDFNILGVSFKEAMCLLCFPVSVATKKFPQNNLSVFYPTTEILVSHIGVCLFLSLEWQWSCLNFITDSFRIMF
jgi:hypothetical protein